MLPEGSDFHCHALWGGVNAAPGRRNLLSGELRMPRYLVDEIRAQYLGTGALFTALFERFDLIIQWLSTTTSQRLVNALASGVPTIGRHNAIEVEAIGENTEVLLAKNLEQLGQFAHKLAESSSYRRRVSDAGVAVASHFSPDAIFAMYSHAIRAARNTSISRCGR